MTPTSAVLPIDTALTGIGWPVVPNGRAALVLSLLYQLEQSQWWPAAIMAHHQLAQLAPLVEHAAATVPFYGPRLQETGWSPGQALTAEHWRRLPVLRRPELQAAGDEIRSGAVPADHGRQFTLMTSGSTGRPVQTVGTALTQLFWSTLTIRDHLWHGRDFGRKLAVIRQFPLAKAPPVEGSTSANWGSATDGVLRTGPAVALDIDRTVREQAAWLARERPGYLLTYPSNVVALARHFSERGEAVPGLREVRTFGEVLEPRAREACRAAWGVPLVDMYSSQEVGYIALQCPEHEHYHVQSENLLVEVVDDDGAPCRPGQVGRVVVTTLHNFATPLLRYELGDFAEVGDACPCGRGLPVLTRVLGRQRNMLTLPGGDQRWPNIRDPAEFASAGGPALPPLQQFQVVQKSLTALEVLLVCPRALGPDEEDMMRAYLAATLGHRFDVAFTYVVEVPRSQGGKFEDFRSEIVT
ncbi:MAG: hypothetical protein QOG43_691 [Actinomycetota bacterium]|nr:hypothetical protein [Actinomycetota bacterium]